MNIYMIFLLGKYEHEEELDWDYKFMVISVSKKQALERLKAERMDINFDDYDIDVVKHDVEEIISL